MKSFPFLFFLSLGVSPFLSVRPRLKLAPPLVENILKKTKTKDGCFFRPFIEDVQKGTGPPSLWTFADFY